mgnify:CR=1 FL=1
MKDIKKILNRLLLHAIVCYPITVFLSYGRHQVFVWNINQWSLYDMDDVYIMSTIFATFLYLIGEIIKALMINRNEKSNKRN